jgi:ABC-type bacteriocin/lantibiotic exporter with double-glycine peptidase domain
MILASFAEVVSIGAVLPFLGVLTAPERVFGHELAQPIIVAFGLLDPSQLVLPLTIIFVIAALVSGVARLVLLWVQTRLSYAIGADLSISIYRRTLYQPYAVHVARNSSEVVAGISNKANVVVGYTIMPALTILNSFLMLVTILAALVAIEPSIALTAIAGFGVIYALVVLVTKRRLAQYSKQISRESNQVIKALQEGLGGIRDVLIDGAQEAYCKIYQNADLPLRRAQANIQIISISPRYGVEALGMMLIAVLAYSLAGQSAGIVGVIPVLGALVLCAQRLLPVLQQAYAGWTSMRGGQATLEDALVLLDQPMPEYVETSPPAPISFQRDIALENLSFRYTPYSPWILREVNFTIPKGGRIGFIGSTGGGKSTLLDIVMGLLEPTEGSLTIDGIAITQQNQRSWQVHVAHVPQSIFLADTTIAENIAFGVPLHKINSERMRQAAQKAQIAETIESWEMQYNTMVGERGIRLSGGQRQRIGIARALYKLADVIVFDEATSALDNETEQAVMEAIENLGDELTILIVAHRLTTLKKCTQVIELIDGKIMRSGNYQEIVSTAA